jgi:predicted HTH domain antitoxin
VTLTLPDDPSLGQFTPGELRIELACALFARGKIGKARGAEVAGVDLITFQRALGERRMESYTEAMLESDLRNLRKLFPAE